MPEVIFGPRRNAAARKLAASQNTDKHPNWGGRRPGSGRKPAGERPLDAMIVVRMTDKQKAFFKMAGGSAWLRRVLEAWKENSSIWRLTVTPTRRNFSEVLRLTTSCPSLCPPNPLDSDSSDSDPIFADTE